ncbi:hypothetical protein SDC9_159556 [bioreactor metagenome]|uniref:Uncharacterized protein n=1 Tax=bioreactor metagenome TaxID=1076179 RepID=A0A645FIH3_9ZZZZ
MGVKIGMIQFNYRLGNTPRWGAVEGDHGLFIKPQPIMPQYLMPRLTVRWLSIQDGAIHIKNQTRITFVHRLLTSRMTRRYFIVID